MENKTVFNPDETLNIIAKEIANMILEFDFTIKDNENAPSLNAMLFAWHNCIYFYLVEKSEALYSSLYSALGKYGIDLFTPKSVNDYNDFCQKFCQTIDSDDTIGDKVYKLCMAIYVSVIFNYNIELDMYLILRHIRTFLKYFPQNEGLLFLEDDASLDCIIPMLYVGAKETKKEMPKYAHNKKKQAKKSQNGDVFPWGCSLFVIFGVVVVIIAGAIIAT